MGPIKEIDVLREELKRALLSMMNRVLLSEEEHAVLQTKQLKPTAPTIACWAIFIDTRAEQRDPVVEEIFLRALGVEKYDVMRIFWLANDN